MSSSAITTQLPANHSKPPNRSGWAPSSQQAADALGAAGAMASPSPEGGSPGPHIGRRQQQGGRSRKENMKDAGSRKQSSCGQHTGKGKPAGFGLSGKGAGSGDESETPELENRGCPLENLNADITRAPPADPCQRPRSPPASPSDSMPDSQCPGYFGRFCCGCGELKYTNHLLLDTGREGEVIEDRAFIESDIGSCVDWQGQLWAYCFECAKFRKMLGGGSDQDQERFFKSQQRKRWKLKGLNHAAASRLRRAAHFREARAIYENAEKTAGKVGSRRARLPFVKLEAMSLRMAADINAQNPARRFQCEAIQAKYNCNKDEQEQETAPSTQAANNQQRGHTRNRLAVTSLASLHHQSSIEQAS